MQDNDKIRKKAPEADRSGKLTCTLKKTIPDFGIIFVYSSLSS